MVYSKNDETVRDHNQSNIHPVDGNDITVTTDSVNELEKRVIQTANEGYGDEDDFHEPVRALQDQSYVLTRERLNTLNHHIQMAN